MRIAAWGAAAALLLLPALAMLVTDEVGWTGSDFVIAGALLLGTGVAFEVAASRTASVPYRAGVGVALAAAFVLVWVNGAVGIIGSEDNPANLMFVGVLAVGAIGAAAARFRASGMARALIATALAQSLVAVIALIAGLGPAGDTGEILAANAFFAAVWLASAWLFRRAADEQEPSGTAP